MSGTPAGPITTELTAFQRDILFLTKQSDGNPTGIELIEKVSKLYGKKLEHGRMFPNLDVLIEKDYLEKELVNRRTNHYKLTHKGNTAISKHAEWISSL